MRAFTCPACSALVFFENSVCLTCGTPIGFDRELRGFRALTRRRRPADRRPATTAVELQPCANVGVAECNWLAARRARRPGCATAAR